MKASFKIMLGLMCIVVAAGCSRGKDSGSGEATGEEGIAARVEDWALTRAELDSLLETLPPDQRQKYSTPGGKAEFASRLIEEELYHQDGMRRGLEESPAVKKQVENFVRHAVIAEYFKQNVEPLAKPTEEEMHEFYEQNPDRYTKQAIARARHFFSSDRNKLLGYKKRIQAGEKWTTLVRQYSEDALTRDDGGDLGYFNPDGYIRSIGYSDEISDAAFSLPLNEISDPIKWSKGYSLLVVVERREPELRTFEEVRPEIERIFVAQRLEEARRQIFDDLGKKYVTENFLEKEWKLTDRTPEELWNLAQNSTDAYHRLRHYEEIVERYPDSQYAAQALFMVGFVNAEELMDYASADRAFTRVMNEYPETEIAKSAKYMLENLKKPNPTFEGVDKIIDDSRKRDG